MVDAFCPYPGTNLDPDSTENDPLASLPVIAFVRIITQEPFRIHSNLECSGMKIY